MNNTLTYDDLLEHIEYKKFMKLCSNLVLKYDLNPSELKIALSVLLLFFIQGANFHKPVKLFTKFIHDSSKVNKTNISKYVKMLSVKDVLFLKDGNYFVNDKVFI